MLNPTHTRELNNRTIYDTIVWGYICAIGFLSIEAILDYPPCRPTPIELRLSLDVAVVPILRDPQGIQLSTASEGSRCMPQMHLLQTVGNAV
jgi:hypothetical protein